MSNLSAGRYLVISTSVPNIVDCGWSAGCTVTLNTGSSERVIAHENKGSSGQYYWAYWVGIVKLTNTSPTNQITVKHNYGSGVTNTRSIIVMKYQG